MQQLLPENLLLAAKAFSKNDEAQPWLELELTADETAEALNQARREKYYREEESRNRQAETARLNFMRGEWGPEVMLEYAQWRAMRHCGFSRNGGNDGKPVFAIDEHNQMIIQALCLYFTNNPEFEQLNANWKLNKGLMLCGGVGVGKTKLMQVFAVNKRQVYEVVKARDLSSLFARKPAQEAYDMIEQYSGVHRPVIRHEDTLWQEHLGLCIDDVGTDDERVNYGNREDVIASILDGRYSNNKLVRCMTHVTTNLDEEGLEAKYGQRVTSRMIEMFNVIVMDGADRRVKGLQTN